MSNVFVTEKLDPVGQEDADIDNDGDSDSSDSYLRKRRKAVGAAIAADKAKRVKKEEIELTLRQKVEGLTEKKLYKSEKATTSDEKETEITEKSVKNKVVINPDIAEGVLDAALKTDKKVGELHKKVDNDVKRMKAGKKFKEEVELDERTRYAKETGKDFKTGNPSEKGGTRTGKSAFDQVSRQMRKTGGVMSSRGKGIQPQGKKKEKGAKGYKGVTPVDKIKNRLAQKRAAKPNPYKARPGESD